MELLMPVGCALAGLLLLIFIIAIVLKNGIIGKANQVDNAFATVDVMLKKRFDLLPQLTECVKGYMKHEQELMTNLTNIRSTPRETQALAENNQAFQAGISQIMIKAEAYPDLKASEQFVMLQKSMNEMEEQLAAARRTYNMSIENYNNSVMQFPSSIIAKRNNFGKKDYLKFND